MLETKKFIFLSRRQRNGVSFLLGTLLVISIALLLLAKLKFQDQEVKALSIDLIKLTVTAWGAWGLILLYASANSFERISKETSIFLEQDISRAFSMPTLQMGNHAIDPLNLGLNLKIIAENYQSAIYEFSNPQGFSIHFHCRLNVYDLTVLIYLPPDHADKYQKIYETSLAYLQENGVKVMPMGVFESHWLEDKEKRFQIQIIRSVGDDFLFDAAKRVYLAGCIFGDIRAFYLRAYLASSGVQDTKNI
jgi:hypothetical protein